MTNLSRTRLPAESRFRISTPSVVGDERSTDGTRKFLLELGDGRRIESVFIPDTPAMTFCISTQVGCAMACGFCLTGKMGLVRTSPRGKSSARCACSRRNRGCSTQPFNIVLMGMGEPLHNYDNTMKALRILHAEHGLAISPRRITLSTVGIVPGLDRLARAADAEPGDLASRHDREQRRRWCRPTGSTRSQASSMRAGGFR